VRKTILLPLILATACGGAKKPVDTGPTTATGSGSGSAVATPPPLAPQAALVAEAKAFVASADQELRRLYVAASESEWANETDITPAHEAAAAKDAAAQATWITKAIKEAKKFEPILEKLDPDTRRQLLLLKIAGQPAPDDPKQADELAQIGSEMTSIYGKGKVCDPKDPTGKDPKHCKDLDALSQVLQQSRKPAELLAAWQGWHDTVGHAERDKFARFVELANAGAQGVGFADLGAQWKSGYDMTPDAFEAETDRLWSQVKPLYTQLHCYARRTLNKKYGDKVAPKTGPIPAHLLGNMWAQTWDYLYPELEPYKGISSTDVTKALVDQKYDATKMVKTGEGFFMSLGFDALPDTFWQRSQLTKPAGKDVVCHASAWDVAFNNDLRIKMCIKPDHEDLVTIHHELGHDYYYHSYFQLPILYQSGANDGFHEAIGDTIALSMTPDYLKQKGLLATVTKNDKATINQQMRKALEKIAFLPFGLLVDKWRWDVFSGKVAPADYNKRWWELRTQYQGVVAPVTRVATDFDAGAKFHVASNTPYMRYFLAAVLQFQFHRALCEKAGFKGPLHECSIYDNKAAGAALAAMLKLGASKPWQDALKVVTGQDHMDATAMLDYFAPLQKWLEEQNKGQTCGW
jgi:peptidyl-dipeptidase A